MNWPFWLDLLVRSAVLLTSGEALWRLSTSAAAAFRHRLLLWVFALIALLPVLSLLLPEIPLSLWNPASVVRSSVTAQEVSSKMLTVPSGHSMNGPLAFWAAGFAVAYFPFVLGSIAAWRLARRAMPLQNLELAFLSRRLVGEINVSVSRELVVPVTCGLWRPRILLPRGADSWSRQRLEAVLRHEFAHIRRHDLAAQSMAHLIAALWWFQPLVWLARRRLRAESELACDAAVIGSGLRPSDYAAELLGLAHNIKPDWTLSNSSIGMVRAGDLERRIRAILQPPASLLRRSRIYALGLILGGVSVAASAVSPAFEKGEITMQHTILAALLTSAGLSAATVTGFVHDANGIAVSDATVTIYNPDNSAKQETVTGSDGKFSFTGAGGGQYILRVEKPGLASIFQEFDLKADSKLDRDFTLSADSIIEPQQDHPKYIRVGGRVAESNLTTKIQPIYPVAAKKAGVQGTVEIETRISKDGVPIELRVTASPSDDLSESALEAVRQWRYRPTLLNGNPIEIQTTVIVNYTLSQ